MPLDPTDPSYRQEVVPPGIDLLGVGLREAYHQPPGAFGAKGNTVHYSGYHRSRRWILNSSDSAYGSRDYSVTQTLDKSGDADWVSAFDFTPGVWGSSDNRSKMRELTSRVYAAAKAKDPRLSDLREFAGTLNGTSVITFNCADGSLKGAFDSSHLDHCHGSFWRSRAANDHSGILSVMLGEDMALTTDERLTLDQILAIVRADRWQWVVDRAAFIAAGGSAAVWDFGGGMGPNTAAGRLGAVNEGMADLLARPPAPIQLTPEQYDDFKTTVLDGLASKIGEATEKAAEEALRRVLGGLDGASPA